MARCISVSELSKSFCKQEATHTDYTISFYNSIQEVPALSLSELGCQNHFFFTAEYWQSFEQAFASQMQFRYAIITKHGEPILFAPFQIIKFNGSNVADAQSAGFWQKIKTQLTKAIVNLISIRLLVSGNTFLTGEYAFLIKEGYELKEKLANQFYESIEQLLQKENLSGVLIKDFYKETAEKLNIFEQHKYLKFQVNPNMEVPIRQHWQQWTDYIQDLTSKHRVRLNKAQQRADSLQFKSLTVSETEQYLPQLQTILNNVIDTSSFKLAQPDVAYMLNLQQKFPNNFLIHGVFKENLLIGFYSTYLANKNLVACFVGMNKDHLKEHDLYLNILYKHIALAIDIKAEKLIFGRTSMEIKSSVGAIAKEMFLYVKHVCPIRNFLVHYAIKNLAKNPDWTFRNPFKTT